METNNDFGLFLNLLKTLENVWFSVFREGIERDQETKIVNYFTEKLHVV